MLQMLVVAYETVEEIYVEYLVVFIWLKHYYRVCCLLALTNRSGWIVYLNKDLVLQPLVKILEYLLNFVNDTSIEITLKLHDATWKSVVLFANNDSPLLTICGLQRRLHLKCELAFEV